jgi:hypothetical protein
VTIVSGQIVVYEGFDLPRIDPHASHHERAVVARVKLLWR